MANRDAERSPLDRAQPWWPAEVVRYVEERLPTGARVFEYGGGGSTIWLRDHGAQVIAVEHDPMWSTVLAERLGDDHVRFVPAQSAGSIDSAESDQYFDNYVRTIDSFDDGNFDLVIVDGRARIACLTAAAPKVKPGGLILLDDSDRARYQVTVPAIAAWARWDGWGVKVGRTFAQSTVWTRPG